MSRIGRFVSKYRYIGLSRDLQCSWCPSLYSLWKPDGLYLPHLGCEMIDLSTENSLLWHCFIDMWIAYIGPTPETRVAIDSLSALERVSTKKSFREFVLGITSHLKLLETAGLFTSTAPNLLGGESVTEAHISTLTDSIILLRYVEIYGEMRRALTVLKMRGSQHDKNIREFTIDGQGMHIGKPFKNIGGILAW